MKDTLRTRLEFLWAKLAGREIDIDTLHPNAPTNMIEKLMLETADRLDSFASGDNIKRAENIPYADGETVTATEFNALIDAMIEAGLMKSEDDEGDDTPDEDAASSIVGVGRADYMIVAADESANNFPA